MNAMLNERQNRILSIMEENGSATVSKLAQQLFVSEMTIRRDLNTLERLAYVKRYHGGAVHLVGESAPIDVRQHLQDEEKRQLCKLASAYLSDNKVIFVDSSSTCMHLANFIPEHSGIKVFTNSLNFMLYCAPKNISCTLIGGDYYEPDQCFVGSIAEQVADSINADLAFLSPLGLSENGVVSDRDWGQTAVRKRILKNARKVVFLFGSSKLNTLYPYTLCRIRPEDERMRLILPEKADNKQKP